jgi:3-dehydroquinate dehydratase I
MICVCYAGFDYNGLVNILNEQRPELAELRLDSLKLNRDELKKVLAMDIKFIATCKDKDYAEKLLSAIQYGADYIDIDIESDEGSMDKLIKQARASANSCKIIISYHDYNKTPVSAELERVMEWCLDKKPDLIKISCMVREIRDNARLLGLLDSGSSNKMIVIGMGEMGRVTRIIAPKLGAFCTYVGSVKGMETAPGQISFDEIKKITEAMDIV